LIGYANVHLESLFYLFDVDLLCPVLDFKGKDCGKLKVAL
jgi:hypothetical protein